MIMEVTKRPNGEMPRTYETNIPIKNIMEIIKDSEDEYRFRLIDGSWTWYYISVETAKKIEDIIKGYDEFNCRKGKEE